MMPNNTVMLSLSIQRTPRGFRARIGDSVVSGSTWRGFRDALGEKLDREFSAWEMQEADRNWVAARSTRMAATQIAAERRQIAAIQAREKVWLSSGQACLGPACCGPSSN